MTRRSQTSGQITIDMTWRGDEVLVGGQKVLADSNWKLGLAVEAQAKALVPRDTGRLLGSITTAASDGRQTEVKAPALAEDKISPPPVGAGMDSDVYIGTAVEYGTYQEFGTSRSRAQPFLRPALDLVRGEVLTIVKTEWGWQFKGYD